MVLVARATERSIASGSDRKRVTAGLIQTALARNRGAR